MKIIWIKKKNYTYTESSQKNYFEKTNYISSKLIPKKSDIWKNKLIDLN